MPEESSKQTNQRLRAIVHGRVQGVNFRAYTARQAVELGLTGWIRNLPDGTVETVVEGPAKQLDKFKAYLHIGPPYATVTDVVTTRETATNQFKDFRVRFI